MFHVTGFFSDVWLKTTWKKKQQRMEKSVCESIEQTSEADLGLLEHRGWSALW